MLFVKIQSKFPASAIKVWEEVKTRRLLDHVIKPLARFDLIEDLKSDTWQPGKTYTGKSYLFSFIYIGNREIMIEKIDDEKLEIQSREKGEIGLKKWDHLIKIETAGDNECIYTDIIEIDAGVLTLFYWLFANWFYRHRQNRWKKLIQSEFEYS